MRTWGRIFFLNDDGSKVVPQPPGYPFWVKVETDANGFDDDVQITTLCQTFNLNLGESPFYANRGLPAHPTIVSQVQPDFYVTEIQQTFAPYFANLVVAKVQNNPPNYRVNLTKQNGAKVDFSLEIAQ